MENRLFLLSYCAGIIDGEGSVDVSVSYPKGARKTPSFRIRLKVSMCSKLCIEVLQGLFGGEAPIRTRKNPNHRPVFEWSIRSQNACNALKELEPFLVLKKPQAILAIKLAGLVSQYPTTSKGIFGFRKNTPEQVLERTLLYDEIRNLNRRGTDYYKQNHPSYSMGPA